MEIQLIEPHISRQLIRKIHNSERVQMILFTFLKAIILMECTSRKQPQNGLSGHDENKDPSYDVSFMKMKDMFENFLFPPVAQIYRDGLESLTPL